MLKTRQHDKQQAKRMAACFDGPVFFERLEPKILLSADALSGLVTLDPHEDVAASSLDLNESLQQLNSDFGATQNDAAASALPSLDLDLLAAADTHTTLATGYSLDALQGLLAPLDDAEQARQEIIFIDAATPDYQQLVDGLQSDAATDYQVYILDSNQDGIQQISDILAGYDNVDAIHLVSHGNATGLQLGSSWFDAASLNDQGDLIAGWSKALHEDADLLIYGCNLAADASGQSLLDALAALTAADVAASDDLTGAGELGGDWVLEYTIGEVETGVIATQDLQQDWSAVLGIINVTTTTDEVLVNGDISLREAILLANDEFLNPGPDEIILPAGTYTLTVGSAGEDFGWQGDLDILSDITITGADAATTIIDASGIVGGDRVFHVDKDDSLRMTDVTVQGGNVSDKGGGIMAEQNSTLELERVIVQNNISDKEGGGIYTKAASTLLTNVTIQNNGDATTLQGGGLFNVGTATVLDSVTISGNQAASGGGITNEGESLSLLNVTISGNTVTGNGGAIENIENGTAVPGTITMVNSTLSGNASTGAGVNGIWQDANSVLNIQNSILNDGGGSNVSGGTVNSQGYNIDSDGSAGLAGPGDLVGDPMLDMLADNGGFTRTHALLSGSAAINTGTSTGAPLTDQRGQVRIGATDIGAYEFNDYNIVWSEPGNAGPNDTIMVGTADGNHVATLISGLENPTSIAIDPDAGKVYWVNDGTSEIWRADLDGSNAEIIVSGINGAITVEIDFVNGVLFYSQGTGAPNVDIWSANLDGTGATVLTSVPDLVSSIAIDSASSMLYWADAGTGTINSVDYAGTTVTTLVSGILAPADIELDLVNDKIYWIDQATASVYRADLADGGNVEFVAVGGAPGGVALDPDNDLLYWSDLASGELYSVTMSSFSGGVLYSGLASPFDVDTFDTLTTPLPSNTAPTATNLSTTSAYNEGDASVAITDIVVSDVDSGDIITATLTLADVGTGSLSANDGATYNALTGVWTITDSVANVNSALANLVFNPNTDNDADTTISVNIDDGDEDGSGALTGTITLDVTPTNDAPVVTATADNPTFTEDGPAVSLFSGTSIDTIEAGQTIDELVLTVTNVTDGVNEVINIDGDTVELINPNSGVTLSGYSYMVDRSGTSATITITTTGATAADIENLINGLSYQNNLADPTEASRIVTITSVTDSGGTANGGADTASPAISSSVQVVAVNDAPTATNLTSTSNYNEGDASVAITDIVVSDVDSGEIITATLTLADASTGSLSVNDGATYNALTGVWTITDSVANVNTALANLVFVPNTNNDVDTSISVSIDDGDEDGSGALTGTITLDVTPANDAPTATNLSSTSNYIEGDASVAITDIVVTDIDTGDIITATLTLADTSSGSLSTNDGATYNTLTGVWTITDSVANVNTALANLVFVPNTNNDVDTSISVSIDDGDEDGSGALTGVIDLVVTPVNDAPTLSATADDPTFTTGGSAVSLFSGTSVDTIETGQSIDQLVITVTNVTDGSNEVINLDGDALGLINSTMGTTVNGYDYSIVRSGTTATITVVTTGATPADIETLINGITYQHNEASPTLGDRVVTIESLTDSGGTANGGVDTGFPGVSSTVIVAMPNVDPVLLNPIVDQLASEDAVFSFTIAANAFSDANGDALSYSASLANGSALPAWLSFDGATRTFSGTPLNEDVGIISIRVTADDGNSGTPATDSFDLEVINTNDAPVATNLSAGISYDQGEAGVALNDIVIGDVDVGETVTATLTLSNVDAGTLSANDGASYNAVTGVWTITGTVADVNTALANVSFIPAADNMLDTTVAVSIDDGDEDASGPLLGALTISVNPAVIAEVIEETTIEEVAATATVEPVTEDTEEDIAEDAVVEETPVLDTVNEEIQPQRESATIIEETGLAFIAETELPDTELVVPRNDVDIEVGGDQQQPASIVERLREQLTGLSDPLQLIQAESFIMKLNDMREELVLEKEGTEKVVGGSLTVSAGLSVGYVVWLARSGVLMSTMLSSLPAWRFIDPLPVLASLQAADKDEDQESLESIVEKQEADDKDTEQQ